MKKILVFIVAVLAVVGIQRAEAQLVAAGRGDNRQRQAVVGRLCPQGLNMIKQKKI